MTDTLPAKVGGEDGAPPAPVPEPVPAPMNRDQLDVLKEQARHVVKSRLAPRGVDTPEKVLVIAMKGREVGIPIMQALSHIHVIEGKPSMSAELMVALVQRAGHKLRVIETTSEKCVVEGERLDDPGRPARLEWTMADARRAGVTHKGPWKSYPAAMLRARAISALCRFQFADVLAGVSYVPEELGASVDEDGQVLDVTHEPETSSDPAPQGEAQAVEVQGDDHRACMEDITKMLADAPVSLEIDAEATLQYASRSYEHAVATERRLRAKIEEARSDFGDSQEPPSTDAGAEQRAAGDLPITRKQLNYLEALVADVVEDGVKRFEEMVGKSMSELTRDEASEWLNRLSGRVS